MGWGGKREGSGRKASGPYGSRDKTYCFACSEKEREAMKALGSVQIRKILLNTLKRRELI